MFGDFTTFEEGVFVVRNILARYDETIDSARGRRILATYVEHVLQECYGDFYHFADCQKCGAEFRPTYTFAYAMEVLTSMIRCPVCREVK